MEERTNDMELVDVNDVEEVDGYGIEESGDSDETEFDLAKVLKWIGIGSVVAGAVAFANRKKIKEKIRKAEEKKMRKLAEKLGYDIVNADDYIEADYEECDCEETCDTDEE